MIVFNSIKDQNAISLIFTFPPNNQRLWDKSTFLIGNLLEHEGHGGLYHCLKEQGLVEKIGTDDMTSYRTVIQQYYIEFRLTD